MIEASLYHTVYLVVVALLTFFVNSFYATAAGRQRIGSIFYTRLAFLIAVLMALFIGLRPQSGQYFFDMDGYYMAYTDMFGEPMEFDWYTTNILFDNLFMFMASKQVPVQFFFLLMAALNFMCSFFACRKLFPNDTFLSFVVFLAAFSTFTYATNGLKAGVAAALFLLAIANRNNILVAFILVIISYGFHHAMQLPAVAFFIVLIIRNPNIYFVAWAGSLLLSVFHVTYFQELFAGMTDSQGVRYLNYELNEHWSSVIRFRPDFVLYSSVPVIIGYRMVNVHKVRSRMYDFILNMYLLTNSVWMLCMYATFTNRIAYLSWLMYPIVLIYPFLEQKWDNNQYKILRIVVYGHLAFTLFLQFIYS